VQLYAGSTLDFIEDANLHTIAVKIGDAYYDYFRHRAGASEFNSWQNSLAALAQQIRYAQLRDNGIVVELQLPSSSARLDCIIFGKSVGSVASTGVLIELKQWSEVLPSEWDDCVEAFVGGGVRKQLHPSRLGLAICTVSPGYERGIRSRPRRGQSASMRMATQHASGCCRRVARHQLCATLAAGTNVHSIRHRPFRLALT
jgi:hypothetical protein